jgi:hypothetical protein
MKWIQGCETVDIRIREEALMDWDWGSHWHLDSPWQEWLLLPHAFQPGARGGAAHARFSAA